MNDSSTTIWLIFNISCRTGRTNDVYFCLQSDMNLFAMANLGFHRLMRVKWKLANFASSLDIFRMNPLFIAILFKMLSNEMLCHVSI